MLKRGRQNTLNSLLLRSSSSKSSSCSSKYPVDDGAGQWSLRPFDVGGLSLEEDAKLNTSENVLARWEIETHAMLVFLVREQKMKVDELRAGIESLDKKRYLEWGYYDKWAASIANIALGRGLLTEDELDQALGRESIDSEAIFKENDIVKVKNDVNPPASRWRKPHLRVPGYIFGSIGKIVQYRGKFQDPAFLAFRATAKEQPLYTVKFTHNALGWNQNENNNTTVCAEIFQEWLEPASETQLEQANLQESSYSSIYTRQDDHHHHHSRYDTEKNAIEQQPIEMPGERLTSALLTALHNKGHLDLELFRHVVEAVENLAAPLQSDAIAPRLVARAWKNPDFMSRLLIDAAAALKHDFDFDATNSTAPTKLVAVANTPQCHNLVVCTLCSCYPLSVLGLSPSWYKDVVYRARAVKQPRKLLKDSFGLHLPDDIQINVLDSTADLRYIVIPEPPPDSDIYSEVELAARVTRDSCIGTGRILPPPPQLTATKALS
mmetsp:Transcript_2071/g.3180  ORF Transcript_2071/g.3180 Transcript_2071/m.3180 type:complete len:493 (+) Transcript_2071:76-1554(+)